VVPSGVFSCLDINWVTVRSDTFDLHSIFGLLKRRTLFRLKVLDSNIFYSIEKPALPYSRLKVTLWGIHAQCYYVRPLATEPRNSN